MNKQYIRNGMEYYMKVETVGGEEYEYRMLSENRIEGLLPLQLESMNQKQYLTFSASGCKPFWVIGDKMRINGRQMYSLVDSILGTAKNINEYFLSPDNLVLETDSLFLDIDSFRFRFLYIPGYEKNILSQMAKLAKVLLEKADKQDNDSVLFAYGFYRILQEEAVDLAELKQYVEKSYFDRWGEADGEQGDIDDAGQTECIFPAEGCRGSSFLKRQDYGSIFPKKQQHTTGEIDMGEQEGRNPKMKKNSDAFIIFLAVLWLFSISGICWALYQIYYYGILEWKRNFLMAAVGFTAFLSLVFIHVLKKRSRAKKAASVFILPSEGETQKEGLQAQKGELQTRKEKRKARKEKRQMRQEEQRPGEEKWQVKKDAQQAKEEKWRVKYPQVSDKSPENADFFSNATMLLTEAQPKSGYPRLVYRHKSRGQHTATLNQDADRSMEVSDKDIVFTHFPFIVGSCTFGVDYSLEEKQVSRFHASFSYIQEKYLLKDLNSTNGTFVNGKQLDPEEQCVLSNGDCVTFADIDFIWLT